VPAGCVPQGVPHVQLPRFTPGTPGTPGKEDKRLLTPGVPGVNRRFYATELVTSTRTASPTLAHVLHVPE
jgi:hypothetical protein